MSIGHLLASRIDPANVLPSQNPERLALCPKRMCEGRMTRFKGREGVKGHLFHLDFTNNKILHVVHVIQRDNKYLLSDFCVRCICSFHLNNNPVEEELLFIFHK